MSMSAGGNPRVMLIGPERLFYAGLLGRPSTRNLGGIGIYVAAEGRIAVQVDGGPDRVGSCAVVPAYTPHTIRAEGRDILAVKIEPETVDLHGLPGFIRRALTLPDAAGIVEAPEAVARIRAAHADLAARPGGACPDSPDFDRAFFGAAIPPRVLDRRIRAVVRQAPADIQAFPSAEACAALCELSVSRFLHLFRDQTGLSFRNWRAWKRARISLAHVNRNPNLAHLALDFGYPDQTHFSRSIRNIFGLRPRDIVAGSRRLDIRLTDGVLPPAMRPPAVAGLARS
ncbi:helix-turn-helix domain-containing protein (plasmid) [Tistrella mobilis]|jgi:AraC-like DNA-binding protein|uniref:helix-turn-helix domain-containing protein n=1 Tax=Tistrella mobilis TaxID=171437 RepID=UPI003555DE92